MGTSVDPAYIGRLQDDIRIACLRLEEHGHESLVITVHEGKHDINGSKKGTEFLEDKLAFVTDFVHFCKVKRVKNGFEAAAFHALKGKNSPVKNSETIDLEHDPLANDSLNTPLPATYNDENDHKLFDDDTDNYDDEDDYTGIIKNMNDEMENVGEAVETSKDMMDINEAEIKNMNKELETLKETTENETKTKSPSTARRTEGRNSKNRKKRNLNKVKKNMPVVKVVLTKLENDNIIKGTKSVSQSDKYGTKTNVKKAKVVKTENEQVPEKEPREPELLYEVKAELTPSGQYRCSVCYQFLSSESHITQHIDLHKAYTCEWCGRLCRSYQFLENHKKRRCERNLYKTSCTQCEAKFTTLLDLKVHVEQIHDNLLAQNKGKFVCSKCENVFKFKQQLDEHNQRIPDCDQVFTEAEEKNKLDQKQEVSYTDPATGETKRSTFEQLWEKSKPGTNTCQLCGKSYASRTSYQRHVKQHAVMKLIPCTICATNFTNYDNLRKHIKRHNERPFYCTNCFQRFDAQAKLEHHNSQSCQPFPTKEELICKDCGYQSSNRSSYKQHMRLHHREIAEVCATCGKSFKKKYLLHHHMKVNHGEGPPLKCEHCEKIFSRLSSLRVHMKTHGDQRLKCEVENCDFSTKLRKNLVVHQRRHAREKPFICEKCGKCFAIKYHLVTHNRIHTGERPYLCDFPDCGKGFRNTEQLKRHKDRHSETLGYVCDYCGRGFKQRNELSHHRLYHVIEYRWPCEFCDEKFKMLKYYKTHILSKHREKMEEVEKKRKCVFYRCTMCPKAFTKKEHWTEHENWHKGHKPYTCQFCTKSFCSKGNLRQHERSHKGTNIKRCVICSRVYSDIEMLKKHLIEKHGLSEENADMSMKEEKVKVQPARTRTVEQEYDSEEEKEQMEGRQAVSFIQVPVVVDGALESARLGQHTGYQYLIREDSFPSVLK